MKTYDETVKSVLSKRNAAVAKRQSTIKKIKNTALSCVSCLVVAFSVVFITRLSLNKTEKKQRISFETDLPSSEIILPKIDTDTEEITTDIPIYTDTATAPDTYTEPTAETTGSFDAEYPETTAESETAAAPESTEPEIKTPTDTETTDTEPVDTEPEPPKPDEPEREFEISVDIETIVNRSDIVFYTGGVPRQQSSMSLIDEILEKEKYLSCPVHRDLCYHGIPTYFIERISTDDLYSWLGDNITFGYALSDCPYRINFMKFICDFDFSEDEIVDWYYFNGGYYLYHCPVDTLLERDCEAMERFYRNQSENEILYKRALFSEEAIKKQLVYNLSLSEMESDKAAYEKLTENGVNVSKFSISDFIFETSFTKKDVEALIAQYRKLNGDDRVYFEYDLSLIDEENKTVNGKVPQEYFPCEIDALLHAGITKGAQK